VADLLAKLPDEELRELQARVGSVPVVRKNRLFAA
jgi:hypothetical protein